MDNKQKLINKIQKERDTLPEYNFFGEKNNFEEMDIVLHYLKTGKYDIENIEKYDLLYLAVKEIETLYEDYGII